MPRPLLIAALLVLGPSFALAAPQLSSGLAPTLGQLRTLTNEQKHAAALEVLAPAIAKSKADSYDRFVLLQIQGRILVAENRLPAALDSLETAYRLGEAQTKNDFLDDAARVEFLQTLAQLHYQIASDQAAPAAKTAGYRRALDYTRRWLAATPAPDANARYFAASLRYSLATVDPDQPDKTLLAEALAEVRAGLLAQLDPPAQLRLLGIAILQQLDRVPETIPHLELLVDQQPDNATLWRQLAATYLSTPSRENNLRAILTFERAQAHGQLTDSQSRLNLAHAYLQVDGHERARELLATGLRDGTIENTARTWQFLAALEQEHGSAHAAVATLREAVRRFPENDGLALELARLLHSDGNTAEAYALALAATKEPKKLDHPGRSLSFLAYLAYERGDHAAAARHLDTAATFDDAKPDDLARLRAALKTK
jgi:Tfp pilus assembly protein PilF